MSTGRVCNNKTSYRYIYYSVIAVYTLIDFNIYLYILYYTVCTALSPINFNIIIYRLCAIAPAGCNQSSLLHYMLIIFGINNIIVSTDG